VPVAGTGGQACAHAPEQSDMFVVSLAHRYTVRPDPSVRNAPAEPTWVVSTVPVAEAGAELAGAAAELAGAAAELAGAAAELAGAAADVLAALLHAAAASTEAAVTASLTDFGRRASSEWILFIVSSWAGGALSSCLTR